MTRKALVGRMVAVQVLIMALASHSAADLGCINAKDVSLEFPNGLVASCSVLADCAIVGGTDCTQGLCVCLGGGSSPFCPCVPTTQAPAMSHWGLIGLVGLLAAVAAVTLRRSTRAQALMVLLATAAGWLGNHGG
jgi:hypothetical protein